jgi:hypothetical protein
MMVDPIKLFSTAMQAVTPGMSVSSVLYQLPITRTSDKLR